MRVLVTLALDWYPEVQEPPAKWQWEHLLNPSGVGEPAAVQVIAVEPLRDPVTVLPGQQEFNFGG